MEFHVGLLFIDGVGIGKKDEKSNPFFRAQLPVLTELCGGTPLHLPFIPISTERSEVIAVQATLGVSGLPQSGTGQTALFTGVNGAKKFGRHFGPYPPSVLRPVIAEKNIFRQLKTNGNTVAFTNAFPQKFFEYVESGSKRLTVATLSCLETGIPLRTVNDLQNDEGISADFIRGYWPEAGHPEITQISAYKAGKHFSKIAINYDFTIFEYWLTDHAGHKQKMNEAVEILERFDNFLQSVIESVNLDNTLLMLISDHGNIEDLSTKSHTRNPVPCILVGKHRKKVASTIKSLTDVTPALLKLFIDR
jgi:hypothetical protein